MSKNSNTEPSKGILKKKSPSTPAPTTPTQSAPPKPNPIPTPSDHHRIGQTRFDEKNIKETLHPTDKDYGFDKIDEAKTPYHEYQEPEDESLPKQSSLDMSRIVSNSKGGGGGGGPVDASVLSKLLSEKSGEPPKTAGQSGKQGEEVKKAEFENKRKAHYDEFQKVKQVGSSSSPPSSN